MSLDVERLTIPDVRIIRVKKNNDARGFFSETYNRQAFAEAGINVDFVQDNHSLSRMRGTVRGLHWQDDPFAQDKLIRVTRGRIWDVVVDIRPASSRFGQWCGAEISAEAWNQIFIPAGFAHGLCTLDDDTEVNYKVSRVYSPEHERGIRWNDPGLGVAWPIADDDAVLSDKDRQLPLFREIFGAPAMRKT